MSNGKITNLTEGTLDSDAVNLIQMNTADNLRLKLDGTTPMTGALNMNNKAINGVLTASSGTDAVNLTQMQTADNLRLLLNGTSAMLGSLNMNSNNIINVTGLNGTGSSLDLQLASNNIMQLLSPEIKVY
jgi:hypothetical protein